MAHTQAIERGNKGSKSRRWPEISAPTTRRTLVTLVLAAIVPLLLFGASAVFLKAESDRTGARHEVANTLERVVDRVTVALQKEVEVAEALAALPSLDRPDLERFYTTAQRIAPRRPLWETVSIADVHGLQIMNILRKLGDTLGPVADRAGFDQALSAQRSVIGGVGPVGSVSGKRLVSISVPVIRDGEVRSVLTVGLSPAEIQGILMNAGAPKDWIGAIADANGNIVAQSHGRHNVGRQASKAVLSAIASGPSGEYSGLTPSGVAVDTLYRRLPATNGWTVHFGIPSATLNGPVSRSSILLIVSCATCALLAAGIAHFTARDLEDRRRESEELSALLLASSEERAAVAIEAAELGTWRLDQQGSSFSGSARTGELLSLQASDRRGSEYVWEPRLFFDSAHPDDRAALQSAFADAARTGAQLDMEFRARSRDGAYRWIRLAGRNMPDPKGAAARREGPPLMHGVLADVHALRTSQAERVLLLKRLGEAQEDTQRRIARELHDQVGQTLTGLSLGLKRLENEVVSEAMRAHVVWLESLTSEVSRDIHRVAADLRPVALDDLGLTRALTALAAELSRRHSVCFDVQEVGVIGRLPANIENAIFRIVQEAFTNVLKHASAATASVILEKRDHEVRIVVEDDGCGFEQGRIDSDGALAWGDKLGLSSIRERLATLGGSFRVETDAGHGVSLFIDIPLDQEMVTS